MQSIALIRMRAAVARCSESFELERCDIRPKGFTERLLCQILPVGQRILPSSASPPERNQVMRTRFVRCASALSSLVLLVAVTGAGTKWR